MVNTDADQIVVAEAGPHALGDLPPVTYLGGGSEDEAIRSEVCCILESGEQVFQDRALRLRVNMKPWSVPAPSISSC